MSEKCGARGFAGAPGCIRTEGHVGAHGYIDGSGEHDEPITVTTDQVLVKLADEMRAFASKLYASNGHEIGRGVTAAIAMVETMRAGLKAARR